MQEDVTGSPRSSPDPVADPLVNVHHEDVVDAPNSTNVVPTNVVDLTHADEVENRSSVL